MLKNIPSTADILGGSAILHGETSLGNHLTGVGTDDVDTKDTVSLGISDDLDETVSVVVGAGTRVGDEGVAANLVLDTSLLELLLVLTNPGDLGVGVDDGGNGIVVDVTVAGGNHLRDSEALILGLVGKHRAKGGVTNAADVGDVGLELRVNNDATAVVELDTNVLETETLGVGATANGDKDDISVELGLHQHE